MKISLFPLVFFAVTSAASLSVNAQTLLGQASLTTDWGVNGKSPLPRKEEIRSLTLGGDGDWKILWSFTVAPDVVKKLTSSSVGVLEVDVTGVFLLMSGSDGDFSNISVSAYPMLKEDWRDWQQNDWHPLAKGTDFENGTPLFSVPLNVDEIVKSKKLRIIFPINNVSAFEQAGTKGIILTMSGEKASTMIRQLDVASSANPDRSALDLKFFDKLPSKP